MTDLITVELLVQVGTSIHDAELYAGPLSASCVSRGITDRPGITALLSNVLHESGALSRVSENLVYESAARIHEVFMSHCPTVASAIPYVRNPIALGNFVYRDLGGYDCRGRGLGMITGSANYVPFALASGRSIGSVGEYMETPAGAADSAVWYYVHAGCAALAARGDLLNVRRRWTGCPTAQMPIGWAEVQTWYGKLVAVLPKPEAMS